MRIILASGSPRRRILLSHIFDEFEIVPSAYPEVHPEGTSPRDLVLMHAQGKARDIAASYPDAAVIGADTTVDLEGVSLGKPADAADATRMLRSLSGRTFLVHTAVCLIAHGKERSRTETTKVTFRELPESLIEAYVRSGEPMDKAGAFGMDGKGPLLIKGFEGDYFNVVGLPLVALAELLDDAGIGY